MPVLMCFSGRLKRKGPADKAYERKQYYDSMGPDARGRAFLAGIACRAGQSVGSAALSDNRMKSTRKADSVGLGDNVSTTWSESPEEERRTVFDESRRTTAANGQLYRLENHPIEPAADDRERMPVSVPQTHRMASRSVIDGHYGSVRLGSITQEQAFCHPWSFHDSDNATASCIRERGPTSWSAVDQSHHTEQLVTYRPVVDEDNRGGHPTPTYSWFAGSPTVQPNYELLPRLSDPRSPVSFDNIGWSCPSSSDCCFDFQTMTGNRFSTNYPNSTSSGSTDHCRLSSHYHQPTAPTTFQLRN